MKGSSATWEVNPGLWLLLALTVVACQPAVPREATVSPTSDIIAEPVEEKTLGGWINVSHFEGSLVPGGARLGSSGLWVDAANGDDANDGLSPATAFRTIRKAAYLASPGTIVHILPGVYRESVQPASSGSPAKPILYIAEEGPGTAIIRGSEPASSLAWRRLTANTIGLPQGVDPTSVYYADLSAWGLDGPPRFVVELDGNGDVVARLPLAREPDWEVLTEWKHHEFWWAADGGSGVAGCDPRTDPNPTCDLPWRSETQLTDRNDDVEPGGIEPGNLTTLGNLTGATLVVIDDIQGHWVYRRLVVSHEVGKGRVTVEPSTGYPNLGWGSKYYVEGKPNLLDSPGEWWYDKDSGRLYLWPPTAGQPGTMRIEISRRETGFILRNRSYIIVDGLTVEFVNGNAIFQGNARTERSYNNTLRNVTLRYANRGLWLLQSVRADSKVENTTYGFTLEDSEIAFMDTQAIYLTDWWENGAAPNSFTRSGVLNTVIRNNELHHLSFRSDEASASGARFQFANQLYFEGNHVHHVAHNGIVFSMSVIQSPKEYDFAPGEIKTGQILIQNNVFEKACQLTTDCGALKIWGNPPDNHVFREVLITGNVLRDTFGWSYIMGKRGHWSGGTNSDVVGMGGFGLYVDHASGLHVYRNIAYNNAYSGFLLYGVWQDGDIVYYNNVAANSLHGMYLDGSASDTYGSIITQIVDNIVLNNEAYGILMNNADGDHGNVIVDHNLYDGNGWRTHEEGGLWQPGDMAVYLDSAPNEYYPRLVDIRAYTPWEAHGLEGAPRFWDYDSTDHDLFDASWPDFHLTSASVNALDRGTTALPESLTALLDAFDVTDFCRGQAYDIGRYEGGFAVLASPSAQFVNAGGVAQYALRLDPADLPYPASLSVSSPSPLLNVSLSSSTLTSSEVIALTIADSHVETVILPALAYMVPITATGGGFTETTSVRLFVGGARIYLPIILRSDLGY